MKRILWFSLFFFVLYLTGTLIALLAGLPLFPKLHLPSRDSKALAVEKGKTYDGLLLSRDATFLDADISQVKLVVKWQGGATIPTRSIYFKFTSEDPLNGRLVGFGLVKFVADQDGEITVLAEGDVPNGVVCGIQEPFLRNIAAFMGITLFAVILALLGTRLVSKKRPSPAASASPPQPPH